MTRVSVIIITYNEARNIEACLRSVQWADEIIVADSMSTDGTAGLAAKFTPHVHCIPWQGYAENKNSALDLATGEWVLWVDADERVTDDLATEIRQLLSGEPEHQAYAVARRAFFLGKWIRHSGWYPGYVVRFFRRGSARFDDQKVHEGLALQGSKGTLKHDLLHYTDDDLQHYFWKFNRYTSLAAGEAQERGKSAGLASILFRPMHKFLKMYFFQLGFLDGVEGFMLALLSSSYVAAKYMKIWEAGKVKEAESQPASGTGALPEESAAH
jgi:hypothetical protein